MALMNWDDSLSVKIKEIDEQHLKLVNMINDLHDAMKSGQGSAMLGKILNDLINYTQVHFSTEEKYFDQFGYTGAFSHKQEHKNFVKQVSDFKQKFDNGALTLSMSIMTFLKDWLINHIKGTDQKYSAYFNEKGLK